MSIWFVRFLICAFIVFSFLSGWTLGLMRGRDDGHNDCPTMTSRPANIFI
jgi:hypothetical protein